MATPARRRRARGPRRATEWFDTQFNLVVVNNALVGVLLDTNVSRPERKGMTLARTILDLTFRTDAINIDQDVSLGMVMITTAAVAAVALPNPRTDDEQPGWIWRSQRVLAQSSVDDASQFIHINEDLHSGRRYSGEDKDLLMIFSTGAGGISIKVGGLVRLLMLKA